MLRLFVSVITCLRQRPVTYLLGLVFLVLALYGCASQALPVDESISKSSKVNPDRLLQSTIWYDGDQQRKLWINPGLVAEFGAGTAEKNVMMKNFSELSLRRNQHSVRIWQIPDQKFAQRLLNRIKSSSSVPISQYSPVLHESSSASSRMRALPGNIIVYLNTDLDQLAVEHWMKIRGFEVVRKLEVRPNAYVLKTGPGIDALHKANALYESGDVRAAFPDWWLESVLR